MVEMCMKDVEKKKMLVQALLSKWTDEYKFPIMSVRFRGWEDLDTRSNPVLGSCTYASRWRCDIKLGIRYRDKRFGYLEKCTLWHEMAHAITYLEDGVNDKHNLHWKHTQLKKPWYAFGDLIGKMVYGFMRKPKE